MRIDPRILGAIIAPLVFVPWVPAWDVSILGYGLVWATVYVVSVAVVEEVIFRGVIQAWLFGKESFKLKSWGISRANWTTSLIFAVVHLWQHPFWLVPGYFGVSLVFGYFFERQQSIRIPIAMHAYYNLALLLMPGMFL